MAKVNIVLKFLITFGFCWSVSKGIFSVQDYCDKFDNYSVKPIICLLKTNTTTTTEAPPEEDESWEEGCSCDVSCFPHDDVIINLDLDPMNMSEAPNPLGGNLRCQPCGKRCPINPFLVSRCNCVAIGRSNVATGPKCRCAVTCAAADTNSDQDPYCIYNITKITKLRNTGTPYSCDCDQSRAAQNTPFPEFTCICEPS